MDRATSGKVAIVTGGGGGMGLAVARLLAETHHVVLSDVREGPLQAATDLLLAGGQPATAIKCDVSDRAAVAELFRSAAQRGAVDVVVHTAGLSPSMADVERILRVNALGSANVASAALSVATEGSCLVCVASSAGHLPAGIPSPRRTFELAEVDPERFVARLLRLCGATPQRFRTGAAYALSKNYVIWLARRRAESFGQRQARIVSVSPGSFDTEMGFLEAAMGASALATNSALGRYGRVEEIAEVLAFCASRKASYITGVDLLVDGGASTTTSMSDLLRLVRSAQRS